MTRSVLRSSLHSTASCIIRLLLRSGAYLDSKSLSGRNNLFAAILIRAVFTPPIWLGNLSHLARRLARSPARAVKPNYLSLSLSFPLITCLPTKLPSHIPTGCQGGVPTLLPKRTGKPRPAQRPTHATRPPRHSRTARSAPDLPHHASLLFHSRLETREETREIINNFDGEIIRHSTSPCFSPPLRRAPISPRSRSEKIDRTRGAAFD